MQKKNKKVEKRNKDEDKEKITVKGGTLFFKFKDGEPEVYIQSKMYLGDVEIGDTYISKNHFSKSDLELLEKIYTNAVYSKNRNIKLK